MAQMTVYCKADAFVDEDEPYQKAGSWLYLNVGPYSGYRLYSLLFFDIPSFPVGTVINSVKLYLYYYARSSDDAVGTNHALCRVTQNWAESSVTWNNKPSRVAASSDMCAIPAEYGWLSWDVTEDVYNFLIGTYPNRGWHLRSTSPETSEAQEVSYRSREYESLKPYIVIDYTPPPPVQRSLADQLGISAAVTDTWKYKGLGKKLSDLLSILDKTQVRLNGKILFFPRDQVLITSKIGVARPGGGSYTLGPTDDSYVWQEHIDTNYGSQENMRFLDYEDGEARQLLLFDLSGVDPDITIVSAKLYLYFYTSMTLWQASMAIDAFRVTGSWAEETVTWNNKPSIAASKTSTTNLLNDTPGWYSWDVKADVEAFLAGTYTNYGWLLKVEELTGNLDQSAYSKETAQAQKPYLKIIYSIPAYYYRYMQDELLINDILTKADVKGQFHRGLGVHFTPISATLSVKRIPRTILSDLDMSPARVIQTEFPVSDVVPKDEVLTVEIHTADGQIKKFKLKPKEQ